MSDVDKLAGLQAIVNEHIQSVHQAREDLNRHYGYWNPVPQSRWQKAKRRVKRPFLWFFGLRIAHKNRIDNDW